MVRGVSMSLCQQKTVCQLSHERGSKATSTYRILGYRNCKHGGEGETVKDLQKLKERLILTAREAATRLGIGEQRARAFFEQLWPVIEEELAADAADVEKDRA